MRKPKAGLLPLYVELYDRSSPELRPKVEAAYRNTAALLREKGLEIIEAPVCRLAREFQAAVRQFERQGADAIITLHLAYSPSLESEAALAGTALPLIVLNTTPDYVYDQFTDADALMLNHGIHGVQDMCNLLRRNGKPFKVCAGHMAHSGVLDAVLAAAKAAMVTRELHRARIGLVGKPFDGMGDFRVPAEALKRDLGIEVVPYDFEAGAARANAVTQAELDAEYAADRARFVFDPALTRAVYDRSARAALAIRRWAEEERLTGYSINFMETAGSRPGLAVMPFTECCTAMARGIGYAGEGDVLTAAVVGALLQAFPETTFTEMFCPDWAHGTVFLSHMGEFNYAVADGKPVLQEKPFPFTDAENPTAAYQTMKGGRAVFLNFAPFGNGRYALTLAPGEMLTIRGENTMANATNGWFRPDVPLEAFLAQFSQAGATHHSALIYGDVMDALLPLAGFLGCELHVIA